MSHSETIAVVIRSFPSQTERFILRELFALLTAGYKLRIYAMDVNEADDGDYVARRIYPFVVELPKVNSPSVASSVIRSQLNFNIGLKRLLAHFIFCAPLGGVGSTPLWRRLRWLRWHLAHCPVGFWLAEELQHHNVTRIHAHFGHITASIALTAALTSGISFSMSAHAYDIYVEPIAMREKLLNASVVVTCTRANLEHLRNTYSEATGKTHLVYHGLLRDEVERFFNTAFGCLPFREGATLLFVGRLIPKKGVDVLLRALKRLRGKVRCIIVGDGPLKSNLQSLATQLGVSDCITFIGGVRHEEVAKYYARASALVVPSVIAKDGDRDGLPNVILESAASLLPIIASDISGIPEFVEDGETGLLFKAGDCDSLACAIERLLSSESLRKRVTEGAYNKLLTSFIADENAKRLGKLITGVIP